MNTEDIAAGIRTVRQIGDYFAELKGSARELADRIDAQQRGYLTPDEEDDVRALLISYWQTRNALFDLICAIRREGLTADTRQPEPAHFLVAFTAAAILVDGARFLRELAEHQSVVRAKLNEPAPQFGVPERVYDTIQKSLLSARNGWHLFHARKYFHEHRNELLDVAKDLQATWLVDIIQQLEHRLDVTAIQFSSAKLRTRSGQLARRVTEALLGRSLYGLQKMAGILASDKYLRPGHVPQLPARISSELLTLMAAGDILVVRKEYALTNYFLPGYWPHAAFFLGTASQIQALSIQDHKDVRDRWERIWSLAQSEPGVVLEAMKDGVHVRSLSSPFSVDSIVVLRPRLTANEIALGIARGLAHEGKPYDFDFDFRRADRLVCTEVIYRALDGLGPIRFPLTKRVGRMNLSGGDLLRLAVARKYLMPVAVYAPSVSEHLIRGDAALATIANAEGEIDGGD